MKSFQHAFRVKVDGRGVTESKEYMAFAKTDQLKFMWTEAVKKARDIICPRAGKKGNVIANLHVLDSTLVTTPTSGLHMFELHNFDDPRKCNFCQKLLHGCYFQGYLCLGN